MADTYIPDDLRDTSQPDTDKNYFKIVVTDLNPGEVYPIQFRWQYEDKTYSDWSASKSFTTASEVALNAPQFLSGDVTNDGSTLVVKWSGLDSSGNAYPSNLDRVDIYINGGTYGGSYVKAGDSFKSAGTKVIAVGTGTTYYVKLKAVSKSGVESNFSTERSATTVAQIVVDTVGPSAPSTGTVTAGIDNSTGATIGFNAFLDISWSAVSDSTLRGYRIRFRKSGSSDPYSYVDSPGTGTTFRLNGLAIGTTYEVAIASYDELNNTSSSYTSIGTATATGTPFIGKNVTTEGYFGASATGDTGTFKFGYGVETGKRGLVFNTNNYWYIDSSSSALFKLGGDTNNYIQWDGAAFTVAGNIIARGGSFSGNILMSSSNASLYNISNGYSIASNGTLPAGSTGFALNATGLQFKVAGSEKITLDASNGNATFNGTMTASSAVLNGSLTTTGTVDSFTGNTLTISGGSISADKVIKLDSLNASHDGVIFLVSDYLEINAETEITGAIQLSGNTLFNGAYNQIDRNTEIGGTSTKNIRNIWIRNTLISATSSDGYIGDVWLQYS